MEEAIAGQGVADEQEGDRFAGASKGKEVLDIGIWQDYHFPARDDHAEPFHSLVFSQELGRAAQRLLLQDARRPPWGAGDQLAPGLSDLPV
jgi:hypothetical protein